MRKTMSIPSRRIALFTLESLANAQAVRRFVADHADEIVLVGLSNPFRKNTGGSLGQTWRHLKRSGPRFLPYLAANFSLPRLRGLLPGHAEGPEDLPLNDLCAAHGIRTVVVEAVNGPEIAALLREIGADLLISFHFDQIFSAETLSLAPMGGINVHPSLLPRHRGPVPTLYALMEQPPLFGVTIHRLVPQIDAGGLLAQAQVELPADVTALRAASMLHEHGRVLLDQVLRQMADGTQSEQAMATLPYCPFPPPAVLAEAARRGLKACDLADIRAALRLRII
jgi:methionyl-tRNA formyltransferase